MIEIRNVSFSYQAEEHQLRNIHLTISSGECVLLCGASGCGKTTITKLINGLIPHFEEGHLEGQTLVNGKVIEDTPLYELSQTVGSVFQNPKSQFFNIDSDSELAFGLENSGIPPEIIRSRVQQVTEELHIAHLLHRNVFSMSGGEKQSLAVASIYAMNPDIYVLDEPSANLDQASTDHLREQIHTIKKQGKTIVIAEHRLYYLADLIDRVVYIADGMIQKEFTRQQFLALTEQQRHALGLRTIKTQFPEITTAPDPTGVLEIRNLTVKIKKQTIFEAISFTASPGKILGITGHNGAGKSTLMRCIAGLIKETSGAICFDGKPLKRKQRNKLCYMIMQDVNHQLFGDSVWDECLLSCSNTVQKENIAQTLTDYGLLEFKDKHPMALSGGQKQRLAIVTGIIAEKKILIFDEPSSGLDYAHMKTVSKTLRELADNGHIVLVVTHDLELLNSTCDQVFKMDDFSQKERFL